MAWQWKLPIETENDDATKTIFVKLWGWLAYRILKEQGENVRLLVNQLFSANRWEGISTFMLPWLQMNPSKIGLDHRRYEPGQF